MSIHGYLQMEFIFWKYRGMIKCCRAVSNMMCAESCLVDFAPCFRWNQVGSQLWFLCCGSPGTIALNTSFCHIWQETDIMSVISLLLIVELWWVRSPVPTLPSMFGKAPILFQTRILISNRYLYPSPNLALFPGTGHPSYVMSEVLHEIKWCFLEFFLFSSFYIYSSTRLNIVVERPYPNLDQRGHPISDKINNSLFAVVPVTFLRSAALLRSKRLEQWTWICFLFSE